MAEINPIRYRGYYYDAETELYYLQSRYYDPAVKRFVNADAVASTGQGFTGYNMFACCGNNPVVFFDRSGTTAVPVYQDPTLYNWLCALEALFAGAAIACLPVALGALSLVMILSIPSSEAQTVSQSRLIDDVLAGTTVITIEATAEKSLAEESYSVYFLTAIDDPSQTVIYVGHVKTSNLKSRM